MRTALSFAVCVLAAQAGRTADKDDDIEKYLKALKGFSTEARADAIGKLAAMGPDARPAVRALIEVSINPKYKLSQKPALEAVEKINPKAYKAARTLILDDGWFERADALKDIEKLAEEDRDAVFPVVIKSYRFERARSRGTSFVLSDIIRTMAAAYPKEKEVKEAFIETITYQGPQFPASGSRETALEVVGKVELDRKQLYKALMSALNDPNTGAAALAVRELGNLGSDAKAALPTLKRLKLHREKVIREAADAAVTKIETSM